MIRELSEQDIALVEALPPCYLSGYIKAYAHAYGFAQSFLKFYASDRGAVAAIEGRRAYLFAAKESITEELLQFLSAMCMSCMTNANIKMPGFSQKKGRCFSCAPLTGAIPMVSEEIAAAYDVLSEVFSETINSKCYMGWYADLSHRIRHQKAFVYTIPRCATVTIKGIEDNSGIVVQLATKKRCRHSGYAGALLKYACVKHRCGLILASQDEKSDRFYEHIGFKDAGSWYYLESGENTDRSF